MTDQITLEEALALVSFYHKGAQGWQVRAVFGSVGGYVDGDVNGNVYGDVKGTVKGNVDVDVKGTVKGNVDGSVFGYVFGNVLGTINGRSWEFVESPEEKVQRLIEESGNQELIDAFNQVENNS